MTKGNIEVELRARLELEDVERLNRYLKENDAVLREERERFTYLYDCGDRTCGRDLRIKETNGTTMLSVKFGQWGAENREEIEWEIGKDETEKAKRFLAALGHMDGKTSKQEATVWDYRGFEVVVVKWGDGALNYLEIESSYPEGATEKGQEEVRAEMRELFDEFELTEFTQEGYIEFMNEMGKLQPTFNVESPLDEK